MITSFFNVRDEVDTINILTGEKSTLENIHANISAGNYNVIHIVGNIFYSKWNPKDSYLMTNNNQIVKFNEISNWVVLLVFSFKCPSISMSSRPSNV